jgi:predicted amidohydrolase
MEDAFGLSPDGAACLSAEAFLPEYADGKWSSSTGSLLWDRLLNAFAPQIRARYAALRQTVLSEEALTGRIRSYIAGIPEELYRQDAALYPDRNLPDVDCEDQMIQYTLERMPLLDTIFAEE